MLTAYLYPGPGIYLQFFSFAAIGLPRLL
jgi:hypothetical protein